MAIATWLDTYCLQTELDFFNQYFVEVFLSFECPFFEVVLISHTFAQLTVGDKHLLFLLVDEVLFLAGLFVGVFLLLLLLFWLVRVTYFSFFHILLEMVVVTHLNSVVCRDLEVLAQDIVQPLGDAEVTMLVSRLDHQEEQVNRNLFVLVQLLEHLDQLPQSEKTLSSVLVRKSAAPHHDPTNLDECWLHVLVC